MIQKIIYILIGVVVASMLLFVASQYMTKSQSLSGFGYSRVATSSTIAVGPDVVATLFTTANSCASRIVSSTASILMLSFNSNITPTGSVGHIQAASTTVAYPSDNYGCGAVTAYAFSSTTITKAEANF